MTLLSPAARAGYYEQVTRHFDKTVLHKPRVGTLSGREFDLAPLLVHAVPDDVEPGSYTPGFGALEAVEDGRVGVNADLPTVYVETGAIRQHGSSYDVLTYRWFYPVDTTHGSEILEDGLRIVLGADGFPIVYETASAGRAINASPSPRLLFVSASFELAANEQFGPTLAGRRFAAERGVEDVPNAMVLRVLEDGPLPLGPYLYIAARSRRVITMHCRCSPSQMAEVIESPYYDLVPFERVRDLLTRTPLKESRTGMDPVEALLDRPLEKVLRWPD